MKFKIVLIFFLLSCFVTFAQHQIQVMSYNIRLASVDDGENHWNIRKPYLAKLINFYEPDFIGTQEGQLPQLEYIQNQLSTYDYIGLPRTNDTNAEYTAIFYRKDKYQLLHQATFWLSQTPNKISKGWDAAYERIATYGLFKNLKTKQKFWIMNTHFDHMGKEARKNSALMIIEKIKQLRKLKNVPVIITGDFNAIETDEPIQILKSKLKDTKDLSLSGVYGPPYSFTGFIFPYDKQEIIDYIFLDDNKKLKTNKLSIIDDFYGKGKYPSDHLPVLVQFEMIK